MSIYKPCDVRGETTELAPELYRSWGLTLGHQLAPHSKFVVGGDVRRSTPPFLAALADGLCRAGLDVVDLGLLPTPMIYYAKRRLRAEGCAIVTASHNPASVNGLKWMLGDEPATEAQVRLLEREAESPRPAPNPSDRPRTEPRTLDVTLDYIAWLQDTWLTSREVQRRVVLDPAHGCWAARARRYLQAVFPRCLVAAIHDTPEPEFGGRRPDCSRPELLHGLSDAVYRERADLGIAFDGDGDRVAFVDNEGTPLTAEEATWVLLQSLGPEIAGQRFVYDLKFSDRIAEIAKGLGAEPVVERSGHTFIRTRMLKIGALFGAEVSGHYFFRSLGAGDDGLFTACQLVAHLARCKVSLAELRRMCPPVHMTPDLRVPIAPDRRDAAIAEVRSAWSQYPQVTIDGVRVSFPHGWALVRGSVTEPALTFRFEASSTSRLFDVVHSFCEPLGALGDQVWEAYETAMVGEDLCPSGQEAADEPG